MRPTINFQVLLRKREEIDMWAIGAYRRRRVQKIQTACLVAQGTIAPLPISMLVSKSNSGERISIQMSL